MSFLVEESGVIVTHLLYQAAVVLAVIRWALSWVLRFRKSCDDSESLPSPQQIRDSLILTTFADITCTISGASDTCAVCLAKLDDHDQVRELRNCCHVFHRDCIDRWVDDDDNHKTCPLCRAPFLTTSQSSMSMGWVKSEPSWAVETLLYLFGDDLFLQ